MVVRNGYSLCRGELEQLIKIYRLSERATSKQQSTAILYQVELTSYCKMVLGAILQVVPSSWGSYYRGLRVDLFK